MTRRSTFASLLLAPALAVAIGVGACGGSSGGGGALSKADFLKQADAICKKTTDAGKDKLDDLTKGFPTDKEPTDAQLRQALQVALDTYKQQADQIDDLHEPSSMSGDVTSMLKDLRSGIDKASKDGAKAFDNDAPDYFAPASKDAKSLGLKVCGGQD